MLSARPPRRTAGLLAALAGCAFLAAPAPAADAGRPDTSLKLVPADVSFYSAMLHNKEQLDLVANSKAWAELWSLPSVKQAWKAVQDQYNDPNGNLAAVRQLLQTDENKDLLALLADAGSDEVFCYGDDAWADFFDLSQQMNSAMQYQPLIDQLGGNTGGRSQGELQGRAVLSVLAHNSDRIKIPNIVIGFKVSDAERAEKQIKRLEKLAEAMAKQQPDFKGMVKRAKVGDASFLTLTVDGSQVPWDQINWKLWEDKPGEYAPLIKKLKSLTLTVSLGVAHGYLLVGIGPSADYLGTLGGDGPRLDQQPEFKPLAKFADKKLTSIGYTGKAFLQAVAGGNTRQLDAAVELAKAGMAKADLTDEERKALLKDLTDARDRIGAELKQNVGAVMSFSFLTDRGYESYAYSYGKHPGIDGSKPLTLLDHLGGAPLIAVVGRGVVSVEDYEKTIQALEDAYPQLDKIAEEKLKGQDKENYEKAKTDFLPLLKRLDETTDKLFIPALKDGQFGFVIDAKWTSKHWFKGMPETETALPGPELGILLGVSDAESLRKAMAEYREIANDAIAKLKTWPGGDKIGDFQIPPPKKEKKKAGTIFFYPLPEDLGLDPQVDPTAGLSDDVAVLTLSHSHAERLLASHPLKVDGGPLADHERPLAGAGYLDWAGLVDAATPWVMYGAEKALDARNGGAPPAKDREAVLSQVRTVLNVLKCFRGATSATYVEDGVLVTHSESVFHDLEK